MLVPWVLSNFGGKVVFLSNFEHHPNSNTLSLSLSLSDHILIALFMNNNNSLEPNSNNNNNIPPFFLLLEFPSYRLCSLFV